MTTRFLATAAIGLAIFFLGGCTKEITPAEPAVEEELVAPQEPAAPSPRETASRQLTARGQQFLADGQPDRAIRVLEQAISLDPDNGQNYYYLAEAWLKKEIAAQAREFNRLAEAHFKDSPQWLIRIAQQADRISELEK